MAAHRHHRSSPQGSTLRTHSTTQRSLTDPSGLLASLQSLMTTVSRRRAAGVAGYELEGGRVVEQSTNQFRFSHTPSPCAHTHVDTLHVHAHSVSHRAPSEGEDKGSRAAKRSCGRRDGVESTPRCTLEQQFYPPFWTLARAWCSHAGPCSPKTSRNSAAQQWRHTYAAAASNQPPNRPAAAAVRG